MRTYVLYGALALAGCSSPEAAFPKLVDMKAPAQPSQTSVQRSALYADVKAMGDATRTAGKMVREGEVRASRLPR